MSTLRMLIGVAGPVTMLSAVTPVDAPCVTLIGMPAMLIVADRAMVPVLAATVYVAFPDPVADPATVIHEAVVDEPQPHVNCVVTAIVPVPPPTGTVTSSGVTENVHDALGSVMANAFPAMVRKAVLPSVVALGAAVNPTLPEPVPAAPPAIVTHDAPLVAVQLHPELVVTLTVPLPPAADSDRLAGEIVYAQAVAAWLTVNVLPPAVTVPVRETVLGFAATV